MVKSTRPLAHLQDTPREALNWRIWFAIGVIGLAGLSRGGDEGTVGNMTSSKSWQSHFDVAPGSSAESNVVSMFQLGNIPGSLLAFFVADYLGRLRSIQIACLLWILGSAIWITSDGSLGQTLAGRFIAGIGVGFFPVVCPTFLSEIAPRTIRGLAVTIFSMAVYVGITVGYGSTTGSTEGFSTYDPKVWKVPVSINFIWAGLFLIGTFFVKESPRALAKNGKTDEALQTLAWYRGMSTEHAYVQEEFSDILEENLREQEAMHGKNLLFRLKLLFTTRANLYRLFMIGIAIQILGQWSGGGSLTIYARKIFEIAGVKSDASLYTTLVFGVVKLVASFCCAFFLVDVLGRKRCVFIGLTLQTIAALYLTIFVALVDPDNADGFVSESRKRASDGAIFIIFVAGIGWALGVNTIQYLIGTEIWQTELRTVATSIIMAFHFLDQYGSSRAMQPMLQAFDRWGLFLFWAVLSVCMMLWIFFFVPETSGVSLEHMDELFDKPWHKIGMGFKKNAPEAKDYRARDNFVPNDLSEKEEVVQVESVFPPTRNDSRV